MWMNDGVYRWLVARATAIGLSVLLVVVVVCLMIADWGNVP